VRMDAGAAARGANVRKEARCSLRPQCSRYTTAFMTALSLRIALASASKLFAFVRVQCQRT